MIPQNPRPSVCTAEHLHPETRAFFEEVRADLHDIRVVLKGDNFGNPGMVKNLQTFNEEFEEHKEENKIAFLLQKTDTQEIEKKLVRWGGIAAGFIFAIETIIYLKKP